MIKLTLTEIIEAIQGTVAAEPPPISIASISTDSRVIEPGSIFFALPGENFDGHDFVAAAFAKGAAAAVVAAERASTLGARLAIDGRLPGVLISVDKVLSALGRLASFHRRQLACDVIGVVGSNGKTTTKAMIDHILSGRLQGRASPKSFNNAVGVPLTLLSAGRGDDYLVVEIGTNAPGEIAQLAALANPEMIVLTSIGEEHLEGLRDLAGVAAEEAAVLKHLKTGGFAALNCDSPEMQPFLNAHGPNIATFGRAESADVRVTKIQYSHPWLNFTLNDRFPYRLSMPGAHNAVNAAGAAMIARRLGFDHPEIAARLETFSPPPMRTDVQRIGPITIINDAYNANPSSAFAAIELLESMPAEGRRILVFGEMRELGLQRVAMHHRVAQRIAAGTLQHVVFVGPAADLMAPALSNGSSGRLGVDTAESVDAAASILQALLQPGDVVLLKASRAVGLERILGPLRSALAPPGVAAP